MKLLYCDDGEETEKRGVENFYLSEKLFSKDFPEIENVS